MAKASKSSKKRDVSSSRNRSKINVKLWASVAVIIIIVSYVVYSSLNKDVAATVNGEKITKKRVDALYNSLPKGTNLTKTELLNKLIDTKLLVDYIKKNGYDLSEDVYTTEINNLLKSNSITLDELKKNLDLRGATIQDVRDNILIQNFVLNTISTKISVAPKDIQDYKATINPSLSDADAQKAIYYDKQGQIVTQLINTERTISQIKTYVSY